MQLSREDLDWCVAVADQRNALARGRTGSNAAFHPELGDNGRKNHILGCCGELCVAHMMNERWDATVNTFKGVADQNGREVRTRRRGSLFVRPNEPKHRPYVLVCVERRDWLLFRVKGWAWGWEAERFGKLIDIGNRGLPVWVLRSRHLHPVESLE